MSVVIAEGLGKAYRRYQKPVDSLKEFLFRRDYHEKFWALNGVSFVCEQGQVIGVIGDNGAGKSTLLKILAGTLQQTTGSLKINGRVSAILELGSGFHPSYTGLENIRLGCAMLGLEKTEIERRIPEIIEFSELGDFVKQPVKTYSSGMFVRLAFSVVTSVDPEVLVVDEALSVGDQHFQKKSMDRMMAFKDQGKVLLFCSHNLYQVKELCQQAIWLDKGTVRMQGNSSDVVDAYNDHVRAQNSVTVQTQPTPEPEVQKVDKSKLVASLTEITPLFAEKNENGELLYKTHKRFAVRVIARVNKSLNPDDVHIGIVITRNDGIQCYGVSTAIDGINLYRKDDDHFGVTYCIEKFPLLSGDYALSIWLIDSTSMHVYDSMPTGCPFKVRQESTEVGVAYFNHQWSEIE